MTLAGVQVASTFTSKPGHSKTAGMEAPASGFAETALLASSQTDGDGIKGYLLASFTYATTELGSRFPIPMDAVFADGFNEFAAGANLSSDSANKSVDPDSYSSRLRDVINRRIGQEVIHTIFLTQIDYFWPKEIRARSAARQAVIREGGAEQITDKNPTPSH